MAESKGKATFKFCFWLVVSIALYVYIVHSYTSGQMVQWYYYTSSLDGYAVDANSFMNATKSQPAMLTIHKSDVVNGLEAVPVTKGQRLPRNANGVISQTEIKSGKRVALDGQKIKVTAPWQIKESKGFNYRDTFKHKGVKTNPWSGVWNVGMIILLGFSLGMLAEGFTDIMGVKIEKIQHGH